MATFTAALSGKPHYILKLDVSETAVDQANNRSQVSWSLHIDKSYYYDTAWNKYHVCNFNVVVNGVTVANVSGVDYDFSTASTNTFSTGSTWVAHSADGTGSATVSGHFGGTSALGSATVNGTIGLSNLIQSPDSVSDVSFYNSSIIRSVSWVNHPTSIKPYAYVRVTRYVDGVSNKVWDVTGTNTTFEDTDFINGYVQYSVTSANGAGFGNAVYSTIQVAAPTIAMTVLASPGTARISWQVPAITNGKSITGYKVRWFKSTPDASAEVNVGAGVTYLDVSVAASQSIYAVVDTLVDAAYGPDSNTSNVAINTPNYPLAPGSVTVSTPIVTGSVEPRSSSVNVTWAAVAGADQYRINITPSGPTTSVGGLTGRIDGLVAGTTYTIAVQAHNSYGWGAISNTAMITAPNVPTAPTIYAFTADVIGGIPTLTCTYNESFNGFSPITSSQYTISPIASNKPASNPIVANVNVVPGTAYTIQLTSTNAVGTSAAATASVTSIGGKIMVKNGSVWVPKFMKAGAGFADNALVRYYEDGIWKYTAI